ncbi:MAG: FtsQ-type POTRA domain-containing protein [Candidatus Auribacterota bacterium]|nr:FtsQ-type POTRA domain-containing protein [Candidatus Auribacterota bacterium]
MFKLRKKTSVLNLRVTRKKNTGKILRFSAKGRSSKFIFIVIVAVILFAAGWFLNLYIHSSPYFNVRKVVISNYYFYSKEDIIAASKIKSGQNIFLVKLGEIAKNIESLPNVAFVKVGRQIPKTLYIKVYEREMIAQIESGRFYPVDEKGVILEPIMNTCKKDLPVIKGLSVSGFIPGQQVKNPDAEIALRLILCTLDVEVRPYVSPESVDVSDAKEVRMLIDPEIITRFQKRNFDHKIDKNIGRLVKIIKDYERKNERIKKYIDLRFDRVPVL